MTTRCWTAPRSSRKRGTDRLRFTRGEVRAYRWIDVGSSYLMSDVTAALLLTQLDRLEEITAARRRIWHAYHEAFAALALEERAIRPAVRPGVEHNGHLYYLLAPTGALRDRVIARLAAAGVQAQFHYVPLHSAPAGRRFGRVHGSLATTEDAAARLVRLPLWPGVSRPDVERVVALVTDVLGPTTRRTAVGGPATPA